MVEIWTVEYHAAPSAFRVQLRQGDGPAALVQLEQLCLDSQQSLFWTDLESNPEAPPLPPWLQEPNTIADSPQNETGVWLVAFFRAKAQAQFAAAAWSQLVADRPPPWEMAMLGPWVAIHQQANALK